jgi:hypothetical protein
MRNLIKYIFLFIALMHVSSCTSTRTYIYNAGQKETICKKENADLGKTVVLLEAAWRSDQKEPIQRQKMALEEIEKAFMDFPCGIISSPGDIKKHNMSTISEQAMLKNFSSKGVDTLIIIRIEELTPRLEITFSIPFLWGGTNEADFRIKVVSVKTGTTHMNMRVKRVTGGPFNIRPAEWSRAELYAAIRSIIKRGY